MKGRRPHQEDTTGGDDGTEKELKQWVCECTGVDAGKRAGKTLEQLLSEGHVLRMLLRKRRSLVEAATGTKVRRKERCEDVGHYVTAMRELGVPEEDLFLPTDVGSDDPAAHLRVCQHVEALKHLLAKPKEKTASVEPLPLRATTPSKREEEEETTTGTGTGELVAWARKELLTLGMELPEEEEEFMNGLRDGRALIALTEVLTGVSAGYYYQTVTQDYERAHNVAQVFALLAKKNVTIPTELTFSKLMEGNKDALVTVLQLLRDNFDLDYIFSKKLQEEAIATLPQEDKEHQETKAQPESPDQGDEDDHDPLPPPLSSPPLPPNSPPPVILDEREIKKYEEEERKYVKSLRRLSLPFRVITAVDPVQEQKHEERKQWYLQKQQRRSICIAHPREDGVSSPTETGTGEHTRNTPLTRRSVALNIQDILGQTYGTTLDPLNGPASARRANSPMITVMPQSNTTGQLNVSCPPLLFSPTVKPALPRSITGAIEPCPFPQTEPTKGSTDETQKDNKKKKSTKKSDKQKRHSTTEKHDRSRSASSDKPKKKGHEHKRKDGHTSSHNSSPGLPDDDDDTPLPPPDELPPELPGYGSSEDDKSEPSFVSRSPSATAILDSNTESGSVSAQVCSDENSNTSSSCGDESEKHKNKEKKKKKKKHTSKNLSTEPSPNKSTTEHGKQHSSTFVVMPPNGATTQEILYEAEGEHAPCQTKPEDKPEEKTTPPEQPHQTEESGSQLSLDSQYCARLPSFRSCDSATSDGLSPTSVSTAMSMLDEEEITTTPLALVPLVGKVYESWPTLDMVLDDPILKATFFTFLQSEYALENVLFYEDVVHYRLQYFADPKSDAVTQEARRIYKDYFTEDSEYEINVSWETKKGLKALFEGSEEKQPKKGEGSFPASVWDEAMNEVMSLLHTDLYVRWYNCMQPPMIDPVEAKLLERRRTKVGKRAGFSDGAMRFLMVKETVRVKAIQQLVDSERAYVEALGSCVNDVMAPTTEFHCLSDDEIWNVFGLLKVLYVYHNNLLQRLQCALDTWQSHISTIGDVFLESSDFLLLYSMYIRGYATALLSYRQMRTTKVSFNKIVSSYDDDHHGGYTLQDVLALPCDRLATYLTFFASIQKYTSKTHVDTPLLEQCYDKVFHLTQRIGVLPEFETIIENRKLLAVADSIQGMEGQCLIVPGRRVIQQGVVSITRIDQMGQSSTPFGTPEDCMLFLFSDILVCCTFVGGENRSANNGWHASFSSPSSSPPPPVAFSITPPQSTSSSTPSIAPSSSGGNGSGSGSSSTRQRRSRSVFQRQNPSVVPGSKTTAEPPSIAGRTNSINIAPGSSSSSSSSSLHPFFARTTTCSYCVAASLYLRNLDHITMEPDNVGRPRIQVSTTLGELWAFSAAITESETTLWFTNLTHLTDCAFTAR